ncbi:MAG: leucine-rich repeat domain-containing protein [Coleofasciculus sp. C1-SOL-03]|uniref:leucine-rich repeat domain-containing protein n=1 Tax=Coleofasciculus sp. C1-SOL-03 TaxID=3069522 RepID=UPI0032F306F5
MDKTAVMALTIGTWIFGWEVAQAANPSLGSSFQEWCLNKTSLSAEARKTVEVLLEEAGTSDCKQADDNLSSRTELDLSFSQITDVSSLSGLTNLSLLDLSNNQITDVSPLSGLTNLTGLDLGENPIPQPTCPVSSPDVCGF